MKNISEFPFLPPKKILLIEPPFYRFFGYKRFHYPITLTLVGTYLKKLGHDVRIYDADVPDSNCRELTRTEVQKNYERYFQALENRDHPVWMEVRKTIKEVRPDIVGLTSITAKMDSTDIIARMAREILGAGVKVVLGGSHAYGMQSSFPGHDFGPDYDEVVVHIPNLVDQTPDKTLLMNRDRYSARNLSTILTTAGCPMKCTFCGRSFDRKTICRNIPSIREELEDIAGFNEEKQIYIVDDCIMSYPSHFEAVAAITRELGLKFAAGARLMALTPSRLDTFVRSGGTKILVGVESGSQRILDRIKKKLKRDDIIKRTELLRKSGLPWSAFIIVGFPFETLDDLKATDELIRIIRPTFVSINRFAPYPGTEIFNEFFRDKPMRNRDLFQLSGGSVVRLSDEMEEYMAEMFRSYDEYNYEMQKH